jgi:hypothetical protein
LRRGEPIARRGNPVHVASVNSVERDERPTRRGFRFSLLALLLFVTLVCVLLAWWSQPRRYVVESMFRIDGTPPARAMEPPPAFSPEEFRLLRITHEKLIKSEMVLTSALRDPQIAALPILRSQSSPIAWLMDQVEVETSDDSELLMIRMRCDEGARNDVQQILNAVGDAYLKDVIWEAEQKQLVARDNLWTFVTKLRERIVEKTSSPDDEGDKNGEQRAASQATQIEIDALRELLGRATVELEIRNINTMVPGRVQIIQKAIARPE